MKKRIWVLLILLGVIVIGVGSFLLSRNEKNNIDELAKKIFCAFYNNTDIQQKLSDEIFSSTQYENLDFENYIQAVNETFDRLKSINDKLKKNEFRQKIKDKSLSENEKLKLLFKQFEANRMETL